eukprot:COSAG04_NODE_5084_length_1745_cov_3.155640_3_plen_82_part_00
MIHILLSITEECWLRRLFTTAYEVFLYSSFSFCPALPWESVEPPPYIPVDVPRFMRGAMFQLSGDFKRAAVFVGALAFVPL